MDASEALRFLLPLVLPLGFLLTLAHCAGMCGPLMVAFRFGSSATGHRVRATITEVLAYQGGRALGYAAAGALVGWAGRSLVVHLNQWAPLVTIILGAVFVAVALAGILPFARWWRAITGRRAQPDNGPPWVLGLARWAAGIAPGRPLLTAAALGLALVPLPCGLTFWALGIAAASAQVWTGALVMVALVLLSTPALIGAALVPIALGAAGGAGWRARLARSGRWLVPLAWAASGIWLLAWGVSKHGALIHCIHCPPHG